jgi:hypothetical protein
MAKLRRSIGSEPRDTTHQIHRRMAPSLRALSGKSSAFRADKRRTLSVSESTCLSVNSPESSRVLVHERERVVVLPVESRHSRNFVGSPVGDLEIFGKRATHRPLCRSRSLYRPSTASALGIRLNVLTSRDMFSFPVPTPNDNADIGGSLSKQKLDSRVSQELPSLEQELPSISRVEVPYESPRQGNRSRSSKFIGVVRNEFPERSRGSADMTQARFTRSVKCRTWLR